MKNPYIAGLNSYIQEPATKTTEQLMALSGKNLGNFMFCASVRRLVSTTTRTVKQAIDLEVVRKECDGIIIPAANWLQPKSDFGKMADLIEAANVSTLILGLGAQAGEGGKVPDLKPGMVRFLKAVSDRCDSMSVRGVFSAEVLNHYGIKNVTVTGCPSLLYHLDRSARVARLPVQMDKLRVATAATLPNLPDVPKLDDKRIKLARLLLGESMRNGYEHIAQAEISMIKAHRGELLHNDPAWDFLCYAFDGAPRERVSQYCKMKVRAFTNIPDWLVHMSNLDFVVGTRLHGIIAALLAGTPAMLITHDSRTVEMAQHAGIPHVSAQSLLAEGRLDPAELLAQSDFSVFNARQVEYFREFRSFLDRNDVPHRLTAV